MYRITLYIATNTSIIVRFFAVPARPLFHGRSTTHPSSGWGRADGYLRAQQGPQYTQSRDEDMMMMTMVMGMRCMRCGSRMGYGKEEAVGTRM